MPTVSLIVPVFNVATFLPQCLASLPEAESVEVILVNDGSTDGSGAIIEEYRKVHPAAVVVEKANGGLSDARNAGVAQAHGEWIYFLDGDDWLVPGAVSELLDFALRERCDIVQGNFYYAYDDKLLYDKHHPERTVLSRPEAMAALVAQDVVKNFAWGKLYKAELVRKHPFRKGVYFEDVYWQHLVVNETERYGVVGRPLYYYRQRPASISGAFSERNIDLLRGYEERLAYLQCSYPELVRPQAAALWRLAEQCRGLAVRQSDSAIQETYDGYWAGLQSRYGKLFAQALRWHPPYVVARYAPFLLPVVRLVQRAVSRCFGKRLVQLDLMP